MKAKLRNNNITLRGDDRRSDTWENISKHHLYKEWNRVCKHFKNRGFKLKSQQYHIDNNWGKPFHKIGYKANDVCVTLVLESGYIEVEINNVRNLWDSENNFWDDSDDRSASLSYLDKKRRELELQKLFYKYEDRKEVVRFKGAEFIIENKKESWHSYHKDKLDELGLEGVKFQMSEYDLKHNSKDKNKKQIECGEEKYFYYRKVLQKGKVYHNINNMWWVLCGGEVRNMASFELFDYAEQPRRKPLTEEQKINRLEQELRKLEREKNYLRCVEVTRQLERLKQKDSLYKVWSLKHGSWWQADDSGYTNDESKAGLYLESNILANQSYYNDGITNRTVRYVEQSG